MPPKKRLKITRSNAAVSLQSKVQNVSFRTQALELSKPDDQLILVFNFQAFILPLSLVFNLIRRPEAGALVWMGHIKHEEKKFRRLDSCLKCHSSAKLPQ